MCSCSNNYSVEENKLNDGFAHENVFDTSDGYWATYSGILTGNNGKEVNTKLIFFVSPFTEKFKFKRVEKSVNKQRDKEAREIKGFYTTFGRHNKKQYETIYKFVNEKNNNESFYFLRLDDKVLVQLDNNKKRFNDGKSHTLKINN